MLFNSIEFLLFLSIVFIIYWFFLSKNLQLQNAFLFISSYIFYGWWDYRFLLLILFSTILDYFIGLFIYKSHNSNNKKIYLSLSLIANLGLLGFFKYYNFFVSSFYNAFSNFGFEINIITLNIILPVGISFYTFQTLSYTIDVYRNKLTPTNDFIAFAAFVSFFPQLVAGPIERASNLLPQILSKRSFDLNQSLSGLRLILWGFLKKIAIADSLAPSVNEIFLNYSNYGFGVLILGAVFFSFQIYCDFSGYTDIARGLSKLLGIELMINFNFPYFSRSVSEFWRRWHISLSTWFRDYLYIPLGGSKEGQLKGLRNVFIIFLVSGFWHGANWTFIFWGLIHACLFIPSFLQKNNRRFLDNVKKSKIFFPNLKDSILIIKTYLLVTIAWVFFRAESLTHAFSYLAHIFSFYNTPAIFLNPYDNQPLFKEYFYLVGLVLIEYLLITDTGFKLKNNKYMRLATDTVLLVLVILNIPVSSSFSFIYFQF